MNSLMNKTQLAEKQNKENCKKNITISYEKQERQQNY